MWGRMFGGKGRSLEQGGFFRGFTDWHSHLLPGVDDGVRTMEEALEILAAYERLGIASVWLTPHVMEEMPNETAFLRERFAELRARWHGAVELHLGSENMLDNLFEERLEAGDVLPIGPRGDHLLVETSFFNPPMEFHRTLARIRKKGFHPVLAHPERYAYMDERDYRKLKAEGVKFQLNLPSPGGLYGSNERRKARWMLREVMYSFAGIDLHRGWWLDRVARDEFIDELHSIDLRTKNHVPQCVAML